MLHSLQQAKRIVVKIGSALLVDEQTGALREAWLQTLIKDISDCLNRSQEIVLVSSGAIALGKHQLPKRKSPLTLAEKQAAAAIGQIKLAHAYQQAFAPQQRKIAQILLTLDDSENRRRYLNAKNTLESLINFNILPIINENDTVATAEIRYGDNDRLAARVAQMLSADLLILLSDIDGLYSDNPHLNPKAVHVPLVTHLSADILKMASDSSRCYGSGGMITKLRAAKMAMTGGCKMVIAHGHHLHPLTKIDDANFKKTWFIPAVSPQNARKNWIAHHLKVKGHLQVDQGAALALSQGKSLLAAGIVAIVGDFHKGDAVKIVDAKDNELGRGLVNYSATDTKKIMGKKSHLFESILGYNTSDEVIHRNDLTHFLGE